MTNETSPRHSGIDNDQALHIHGSIDKEDEFPPDIGHGDIYKIKEAKEKSVEAWDNYDNKVGAIYTAVANYYDHTLKDVSYYLRVHDSFFKRLSEIEEVFVIGHSFGVVDLPYFREVLANVPENTFWNIFYFKEVEKKSLEKMVDELGIKPGKCAIEHSSEFYGLA